MKKTLVALLAAATLLSTPVEAKVRSVRTPKTVAVIGTTASVTNTGAADAYITRCLEEVCQGETIKPGSTSTYQNLPADKPMTVATFANVSVHGEIGPLTYSGETHVLPTLDPSTYTMRVGIIAQHNLDVRHLNDMGVQVNVKAVAPERGITWFNPSDYFSLRGNEQIELNAPAFIELTHKTTGKKSILPAQPLSAAVGETHVAHVTPNTSIAFKNVDPAGIVALNAMLLPENQDNSNITQVTTFRANNYGVETQHNIFPGTGAALVQGSQTTTGYKPVLHWAIVDGDYVPASTAAARAASQPWDVSAPVDLSFNGLPNNATLYLVSRDTSTGIVKVLDAQGNAVKDIPISLRNRESRKYILTDLPAGMYRALVQLNQSNNDYHPEVTGVAAQQGTNGTVYKEGTVVARAVPQKQYEMTTDITVWANGRELHTFGTTKDLNLMKIVIGSGNLEPFKGFHVYDHNTINAPDLHKIVERVKGQFSPGDYRTVFNESYDNLKVFFEDADGDGSVLDVGAADWAGDNNTSAPGNQANGIVKITYDLKPLN